MTEQTQKLRETGKSILMRVLFPEELMVIEEVEGHPRYFINERRAEDLMKQILQACKEAGLVWLDDVLVETRDSKIARIKEIEIED